MKSVEISAKTVEDAIRQGLKELGLSSSTDVDIDVLDLGSPGLFGMFGRLAKVRLTVKEQDTDLDFIRSALSGGTQGTPPKPKPAPPKAALPKPTPPKPAPPESIQPEPAVQREAPPSGTPAEKTSAGLPERKPRPERRREDRPAREPRPAPAQPQPADPVELPPTDVDALSETGRQAYDFLARLTELMGVKVDIRLAESDGQITAQMYGDTLGILIGRRGDTLDALQYLTSLVVNRRREEYIRVSLDTEHYRARREEALIKLANRMAARARKTGGRVALEPMNPYERRILHSALQNHPYVTTHSEGDDPYRRVIITVK